MYMSAEGDYGRLVAKALADPAFKQRLMDDPGSALAEAGISLGDGAGRIKIEVHENTGDTVHIVLPSAVLDGELSDEDIGRSGDYSGYGATL